MIALAKFCIEDTGPEIIPGKEGLETAVQERASAFYNLMFTHGSFCQECSKQVMFLIIQESKIIFEIKEESYHQIFRKLKSCFEHSRRIS